MSPESPRQGDIWLTAFGAARPGEPSKTRPAVVLSRADQLAGSVYDLVVVAPLSATLPPSAVRPAVLPGPVSGLERTSVVVVRALRGMARSRLVRRLGRADTAVLQEVRTILDAVLEPTGDDLP